MSHSAAKKQKALDSDEEDEGDKKSRKKGKDGKGKAGGDEEEGEDEGKTALVELALTETGKLAPYMVGSRKAVKVWLKVRRLVRICGLGEY